MNNENQVQPAAATSGKLRVATIWLEGCSGCHMSVLDIDQRIIALAEKIDVVYGPLVDAKEIPANVDLFIVEGGVATNEDVEKVHKIRKSSKVVLCLGDCAVTGNVPSMRNPFDLQDIFQRAFIENVALKGQVPSTALPRLLDKARPVHEFIKVDLFVPGCPPPADAIWTVLTELLAGRTPDVAAVTRFGR